MLLCYITSVVLVVVVVVVCGSLASILAWADPHVSQLSVTFHSSMEFHWRLAGEGGGKGGGSGVLARPRHRQEEMMVSWMLLDEEI